MKAIIVLFLLTQNLFAQDGPKYLPVENISAAKSARETADVYLSFQGNKAELFRQSLPPIVTSFPGLSEHVNEIVFLDEKTKRSIIISCSNAMVDENFELKNLPKTKCSIRMVKHKPSVVGIQKEYGDATELTEPVCQKL